MGVSALLAERMKGIQSERRTLPSTSVWYQVPVPTDYSDIILVVNEDSANGLRVAILDDDEVDPNRVLNFDITYGYLTLTHTGQPRSHIAIGGNFYIWVQPTTSDQVIYYAVMSKMAELGAALRRKWYTDEV